MNAVRVLIVVEEGVDARNVNRTLKKWGHNITGIYDSDQKTVFSIKKDKPDLVLMCSELYDSKNIEIARQIKTQISVPIIHIYLSGSEILQCTNASATSTGYIVKPYNAETLRSDIENGVHQHYHDDQNRKCNTQLLNLSSIRVLLVDDRQVVLWGLERLVDGERPRMEVVGTAGNGADAIRLTKEKQPDILLLSIKLDDEDCAHLVPDIVKDCRTRVLIYTKTCDFETAERTVLNGASGVIYESSSTQSILRAIEKTHAGEIWLDRRATSRILNSYLRLKIKNPVDSEAEKIAILTRKECVVVNAFAQADGGTKNKQIAATLCISDHTLRNHLTSIFSKLEITNRYDLFVFAKRYFCSSDLINPLPETIQK